MLGSFEFLQSGGDTSSHKARTETPPSQQAFAAGLVWSWVNLDCKNAEEMKNDRLTESRSGASFLDWRSGKAAKKKPEEWSENEVCEWVLRPDQKDGGAIPA